MQHGFIGTPEQAVFGAKLAFGDLEDFLMSQVATGSCLYTSHYLLSCVPLSASSSQGSW
jgi:hypothetical protein